MDNKMFCFQCEQAAHCTGCTGSAGVCGKSAETANMQDELPGALIGLARAADGSTGVLGRDVGLGDAVRRCLDGAYCLFDSGPVEAEDALLFDVDVLGVPALD